MKFYVSTTRIKRVKITRSAAEEGGAGFGAGMKGKGLPEPASAATDRLSYRLLFLPTVLALGILLLFLFFRISYIIIESATACSSSFDCMEWSFFGGSDTLFREELIRVLAESNANNDGVERGAGKIEGAPTSFKDLLEDVISNRQDIKTFAFKAKAMVLKMEQHIQSARRRESISWHLASHGVPRSLHCLCLKLSEEYSTNANARSGLPLPEFVSYLTNPSFHHVILLTDNVLAASVVISSAVKSSLTPEKLVFHIVTDKKTYTPMHAWFAINSFTSAVVEVKGLHQYDWSHEVNVGIREMLEINRLIWSRRYEILKEEDIKYEGEYERNVEFLSPRTISLLNHLRIYIPELFPDLNRIVFLDDDIVVQYDLSSLWELDLEGKVVGAVFDSLCGRDCCPGRKYKDYFNFTNPFIASKLDHDRCGWLSGMNVFDLEAWRRTDITDRYHDWLKLNLNSGLALWNPGALPPALLAFEGYVQRIDPFWHLAGLGDRFPQVGEQALDAAVAVVHFSGPAKPWLEIAAPDIQRLWNRHVNFSDEFVKKCIVMG